MAEELYKIDCLVSETIKKDIEPAYNHTKNHITAQGKILKIDEDTRSNAINSNPIFRLTRFCMVPCEKPYGRTMCQMLFHMKIQLSMNELLLYLIIFHVLL